MALKFSSTRRAGPIYFAGIVLSLVKINRPTIKSGLSCHRQVDTSKTTGRLPSSAGRAQAAAMTKKTGLP